METLSIVFPVFAIIGAGYLLASLRKIDLTPVMDLLLYVTIPSLILSTLTERAIAATELLLVAAVVAAVVAGTGAVAALYLKATGTVERRGFYLTTMFMNSGNMGFPLALLAFGAEGLTIAILYYVAVSSVTFTAGIYVAKGEGGLKEVFKIPLVYATAIALAMNFSGVSFPSPIFTTFEMLGAPTIPLMQLALGYKLYSARSSLLATSVAASVIRIGGGVLIAWGATEMLGMEGTIRNVVILSSSMPSAVINLVMSVKYDSDPELVASVVAVSTFMSLFTAPLVLMWIMSGG